MKAQIKIGDSFALPIQFYNTTNSEPVQITDDMQITCQIINSTGQTIAKPNISRLQELGMILLEVAASETQHWKVGSAQLDIKLQIHDQVRHSQNIQFSIERSITA